MAQNEDAAAAGASTAASLDPMADPFYLHGSEQPWLVLVAENITPTNYNDWSKAMYNALGAKNKLGFINDTLAEPEATHPIAWAWARNNIMVLYWIQQAVDPGIRKTIMSTRKASEAWTSLRARYGQGDMIRVVELIESQATLKQGNRSVTEYYGDLIAQRDELDNYQPLDLCVCTPTSHTQCREMQQVLVYRDTNYVIQFLRGLNDNYNIVRSQVLFGDTLPSIDRVFQRVLQHDRQLYGTSNNKANPSDPMALASTTIPGSKKPKPFCTYCKAQGHTDDICFHKHGWPQGMTSKGTNSSGKSLECTYCKKLGHTEDKCFSKHGYPPSSTTTGRANNNRPRPSANATSTTDAPQEEFKLTKDDYDRLMKLMTSTSQQSTGSSFSGGTFCSNPPQPSGKYSLSNQVTSPYNETWILDTGASDHIVCSLNHLINHRPINAVYITFPTGKQVQSTHVGTVHYIAGLILEEVLFVPQFIFNLVSVSKLTKNKPLCLTFFSDVCLIQDMQLRKMTGSAKLFHGLYLIDNPPIDSQPNHITTATTQSFDLWHYRLGHVFHSKVPILQQLCTSIETYRSLPCDVCHFAKQKRLPFPISSTVSVKPFQLIHVDIWGPNSIPSHDGFRYFLTIVDDYTRMTWIILLTAKSEARTKLQSFCTYTERQFETPVRRIRSDQGREFQMTDFFQQTGIFHEQSCVETPQQNIKVERKHQHILAIARALMFQSNLPTDFWGDCVKHAVYLINSVPTTVLNNLTPYEKLHNKPPDLTELRVFGCLCFASTITSHRTKFDPRARKGVFIGFTPGIKGYRIYYLTTHDIFTSRDVIFHEQHFPFQSSPSSSITDHNSPFLNSSNPAHFDDLSPSPHPVPTLTPNPQPSQSQTDSDSDSDTTPPNPSPSPQPSPAHSSQSPPIPLPAPTQPTRKSTHVIKPPSKLQSYHCNLLQQQASTNHSSPLHNPGISHPLSNVIHYDSLEPSHRKFLLSISSYKEPATYKEAVLSPEWNAAMEIEKQALEKNHTWDIVEKPEGVTLVGNKWIYKQKFLSTGIIERHKARLVAKGYTQQEGVDYQDTFAPVVKMTTIRLFLAIAASQRWHIHQLDINNAFLHGELEEDVYMKLPDGYIAPPGFTTPVCKLRKSLYGLKQASRQWFAKLAEKLKLQGYIPSQVDHSLFYKATSTSYTCVLVYVDDLVVGGTDINEITSLKLFLHQQFSIKDMGELHFFLGIEVARTKSGIHISQRKYTLEIIEDADLLHTKPVSTPMDYKSHLSASTDEPYPNPEHYRHLVGKLIYLTTTRPDISFATQQVSQFMSNPTISHYKAVTRILRYLKHAPSTGLLFSSSSSLQLQAFSDSDWAACVDSRRSITGYCVYLGSSLVSWKSQKQTIVSRSSCEAEYRALAYTSCEVQWLLYLLHDFRIPHPQPVSLYCDNQSAIYIAQNPTFHECTKHIELDCHFIRDKIQAKTIKLLHISTVHQLANLFTKPLPPATFAFLLSKLGVHELCPPACPGGGGGYQGTIQMN
ncbi:unnamed protein product [Linum trigynum]|uniref:Integrase catalytic domain-containing protein n=1 Tax=Linum trigynum TaxID=586398 RepID=A0AAV2FHU1_9ROSI